MVPNKYPVKSIAIPDHLDPLQMSQIIVPPIYVQAQGETAMLQAWNMHMFRTRNEKEILTFRHCDPKTKT